MYNARIMNSEALIDDFIPRPKINRLPSFIAEEKIAENSEVSVVTSGDTFGSGFLNIWTVALLAVMVLLFLSYRNYNESMDRERLISLVNSTDDMVKVNSSTLYFKDNNGAIAGQMVRVAPESENIIINTINNNMTNSTDDADGRELLTIVGKH